VHYLGGLEKCWVGGSHVHEGLGVGKQTNGCTKRNLVICNHSFATTCDYMQLHATSYHVQLCVIIFTTSHYLLAFMIIFVIMV
jgi:hypothetical protein